jgi:hypothetical protein
MPQFRFQFINSAHRSDCGVLDLPNDQVARHEAELESYDLLNDPDCDWRHWTLQVTDETDRHVISVRIGEPQRHQPASASALKQP